MIVVRMFRLVCTMDGNNILEFRISEKNLESFLKITINRLLVVAYGNKRVINSLICRYVAG
jgi:hypothetical protein